jgi:hypothetical protein
MSSSRQCGLRIIEDNREFGKRLGIQNLLRDAIFILGADPVLIMGCNPSASEMFWLPSNQKGRWLKPEEHGEQ